MSNNRNDRKQQKRWEAEHRLDARSLRSDADQLEHLENLGHGECKEARRLRSKLYAGVVRDGGNPFEEA